MTLGDPHRLTGGYLYHLRMAEAAPAHRARIEFVSVPDRPFPLPAAHGRAILGKAATADAVLLDSIAAAFVAPALAVRAPRVPLIGVLHQPPGGIDHGPLRRAVQRPLDRLAYRRARLLIVASELLADELAAAGFERDRLRVVPPGRDVAPAPAAAPELRRGTAAAFLCVANWVERKGILELLEAFARVPRGLGTLHLAGDETADAAYASRVRERLAAPDVAGRVVAHGPLSRDDVAALYAGADVFVLPSTREPFGTVFGEAMAAGLPVVGWRAGNLPHLADDGKEGVVLDPRDVDGLAEALTRLARDEELRRELGEAARRRASTRPTWAEAAGEFFGAIRSAVATAAPVVGSAP